MGLIPAIDQNQGLPHPNRLDALDRIVPTSRAPTDANSTDPCPYVPDAADIVRQAREQAGTQLVPADVGARQATREADWQRQLAEYEASKKLR